METVARACHSCENYGNQCPPPIAITDVSPTKQKNTTLTLLLARQRWYNQNRCRDYKRYSQRAFMSYFTTPSTARLCCCVVQNRRIRAKWWIGTKIWRKQSLITQIICWYCYEPLRNTMKNFGKDILRYDWDLNKGPPECVECWH
jgi:hypothetical protein